MLPRLLEQLREFNHSQQKLSSIFIILGHIALNTGSVYQNSSIDGDGDGDGKGNTCTNGDGNNVNNASSDGFLMHNWNKIISNSHWLAEIIGATLPWLACASGLPRSIAQLVIHTLIPIYLQLIVRRQSDADVVVVSTKEIAHEQQQQQQQQQQHEEDEVIEQIVVDDSIPTKTHVTDVTDERSLSYDSKMEQVSTKSSQVNVDIVEYNHIYPLLFSLGSVQSIYKYLDTNKDSIKVLARQRQFYQDYNIFSRCSVRGLYQLAASDSTGEIVNDHLLTILTDMLRANAGKLKQWFCSLVH